MTKEKVINLPSVDGFFGNYGGQFIEEELKEELQKITDAFMFFRNDEAFNRELENLLRTYVGRPSPLYFAGNLSAKYGADIYLKREDLNHTGAHKINHSLAEALLAKKIGKKKIIAETGAGQHGVATATAAALLGLECDIYMGEKDIEQEKPNVDKMRILGARVVAVLDGGKSLKEAVDAAFLAYKEEYETAIYAIGSVVGPHPFPMMVEHFQTVIGQEARKQFFEMTNGLPDCVIACVGGGSNSIGLFNGFLDDEKVKIFGVEPLGKGKKIGDNSASLTYGRDGIIHGFRCKLLQDETGKAADAYSIASGLDYPGVGPKHCYLQDIGRVSYVTISDEEAVAAFFELSRTEGIIPALESSHAVAYAIKYAKENSGQKILMNLSGRGDKDVDFVLKQTDMALYHKQSAERD